MDGCYTKFDVRWRYLCVSVSVLLWKFGEVVGNVDRSERGREGGRERVRLLCKTFASFGNPRSDAYLLAESPAFVFVVAPEDNIKLDVWDAFTSKDY